MSEKQEVTGVAAEAAALPGSAPSPTVSAVSAAAANAGDLLRMDYINSLPQPFIARLYGGSEWPVYDIDVQTGLMRLDVCGKLDISHVGNVRVFVDANGVIHDADDFYREAAPGIEES